jgi:hypothetical protein
VILVDTDVLIGHLRGWEEARAWLVDARKRTGPLHISCVTATELLGGMRSAERGAVRRLLDSLLIHDVDEPTARRAGSFMRSYRRSHSGIGLGDYLIAATAIERDLDLATLNTRHFPMLPDVTQPFVLP